MFISFRTSVFSVWTSVFIFNDKCFYVLGQVLGKVFLCLGQVFLFFRISVFML